MPRGRYHPSTGQQWRQSKADIPRTASPPLGDVTATIHRHELVDAETKDHPPRITGCRDVSSYNWLNETEPTILTPGRWAFSYITCLAQLSLSKLRMTARLMLLKGKPPAWTPLSSPVKLQQDKGEYFRDPNAARYPAHPVEPGVRAVLDKEPDFPTTEMDIVACSSTFGNLLRFVRKQDHSFRILVEVIGSTVFLVRRENSPTELIAGVYGYGHSFPDAYTTWTKDVKGSESHQRIIQYTFGGLDCLLRFEADGHLPQLAKGGTSASDQGKDDDQPLSAENMTLGPRPPGSSGKTLKIRQGGQYIPNPAIFDLKTRSIKKKEADVLGEQIARLWVTQIPNFVLAFHKLGVFEEIDVRDVRREVRAWEEDNEIVLRQFATLLRDIVSFARGCDGGRLELRRQEGSSMLELRTQADDAGCALPGDLKERWTSMGGGEPPPSPGDIEDRESDGFDWIREPEEGVGWIDDDDKDFTACSAHACGYCGYCSY